jgi:hypothetical protein
MKSITILICSLLSISLLSGCAVQEEWAATGGSRADGTVQLSYQYGAYQKPEVDDTQGAELAASRCAVWGYTGSEAFGTMRKCEAFGGYGNCLSWLVTRNYQCTGAPSSSNAPQTVQSVPAATNVAHVEAQPPPVAPTIQSATNANAPSPNTGPRVNPNALTNKPTSFDKWDAP